MYIKETPSNKRFVFQVSLMNRIWNTIIMTDLYYISIIIFLVVQYSNTFISQSTLSNYTDY